MSRYAIYEDPRTHKFTFLKVSVRFAEGDKLPAVEAERWFASLAEALAALPELLNRE